MENIAFIINPHSAKGKYRKLVEKLEQKLQNPETLSHHIYSTLKAMIGVRKAHPAFSRGTLEFLHVPGSDGQTNTHILAYRRKYADDECVVIQNLSSQTQQITIPEKMKKEKDWLDQPLEIRNTTCTVEPYACYWL